VFGAGGDQYQNKHIIVIVVLCSERMSGSRRQEIQKVFGCPLVTNHGRYIFLIHGIQLQTSEKWS
jgi:hypothetical protein